MIATADPAKSLFTGALQFPAAAFVGLGWLRRKARRDASLALALPLVGIVWGSMLVFAFGRLAAPVMPYLLGIAIIQRIKHLKAE